MSIDERRETIVPVAELVILASAEGIDAFSRESRPAPSRRRRAAWPTRWVWLLGS